MLSPMATFIKLSRANMPMAANNRVIKIRREFGCELKKPLIINLSVINNESMTFCTIYTNVDGFENQGRWEQHYPLMGCRPVDNGLDVYAEIFG